MNEARWRLRAATRWSTQSGCITSRRQTDTCGTAVVSEETCRRAAAAEVISRRLRRAKFAISGRHSSMRVDPDYSVIDWFSGAGLCRPPLDINCDGQPVIDFPLRLLVLVVWQ